MDGVGLRETRKAGMSGPVGSESRASSSSSAEGASSNMGAPGLPGSELCGLTHKNGKIGQLGVSNDGGGNTTNDGIVGVEIGGNIPSFGGEALRRHHSLDPNHPAFFSSSSGASSGEKYMLFLVNPNPIVHSISFVFVVVVFVVLFSLHWFVF